MRFLIYLLSQLKFWGGGRCIWKTVVGGQKKAKPKSCQPSAVSRLRVQALAFMRGKRLACYDARFSAGAEAPDHGRRQFPSDESEGFHPKQPRATSRGLRARSPEPEPKTKSQEPKAHASAVFPRLCPQTQRAQDFAGKVFRRPNGIKTLLGTPGGEGARGLRPQKLSVVSCRLSEKPKPGARKTGSCTDT